MPLLLAIILARVNAYSRMSAMLRLSDTIQGNIRTHLRCTLIRSQMHVKSLWLPQEEHLALLVNYKLVFVDYSWCNYLLH